MMRRIGMGCLGLALGVLAFGARADALVRISVVNAADSALIPETSPLEGYAGGLVKLGIKGLTDTEQAGNGDVLVRFDSEYLSYTDSSINVGASGFFDTLTTKLGNTKPTFDNATGTYYVQLFPENLGEFGLANDTMVDLTFRCLKPTLSAKAFFRFVVSRDSSSSGARQTIIGNSSGNSIIDRVDTGYVRIHFADTPLLSSPATNAETNAARPVFVFTFPDTGSADSYAVLIDTTTSFNAVARGGIAVENNTVDTESFTPSSDLPYDTTYYWRVAAAVSDGLQSDSSATRTLFVRKPATLDVVRVVTNQTTVTRGQGQVAGDSIIVQVVVRNTAAVDSAGLSRGDTLMFRRARDGANVSDSFTVIRLRDTSVTNDTIIPAGSVEDTFSYYVIIKSGADTGFDTITAYFEGVDTKFNTFTANGSDSDAGDNDSFVWRVNAAAELSILTVTVSADSVTRGQGGSDSVQVVVTVANIGDNSCTVTADTLVFLYDGSASDTASDSFFVGVRSASATTIAGGATETFTYRFSVKDTAPLGRLAVHDTVSGLDIRIRSATNDSRANNPDTVVVQTPARPYIGYVTSAVDTVYQGKSYPLYVYIMNIGGARLVLDSGNLSCTFIRRDNGQPDTDGFTISARNGPGGVTGGSGDTYTLTISVTSQADTTAGVTADTVDVTSCTGTDGNRASLAVGDTDGGSSPASFLWGVEGAGVLSVANVVSLPDSVTRGQSGIKVGIVIRNSGQGAVQNIETPVLRFSRSPLAISFAGETEFTRVFDTSSVTFPASLSIGAQFTCTFTVSVSDTAGTGAVYGLALCSGAITGGSDTISADSKAMMETWVVQTPAVVDIVSVILDTNRIVNNDHDTVRIAVCVRNTGEATLIYTGDTAVFSNKTDSWTKVSSSRGASVAGGAYDTFYQYYRTRRSTAGTATVNQIVYGVDGNDSRTLSDSGASATAAITVDTPRPFTITRVEASRQTVSDSQTANWTVTVTVRNYGADTAFLDSPLLFSNLTFRLTTGESGLAADYLGTAPAVFEASGTTTLGAWKEDTLIYTVTQTGDSAGPLKIDVTLTGYDMYDTERLLTRSTLTDDTTAYDTALVQNRAALSVIRVNAAADSVTQGQGGSDSVTLTVEVRNTGEAEAGITTDTLTFFKTSSGAGTSTTDSYLAIRKTSGQPTKILGNTSETWTYVVSVSATADTVVTVIEATFAGTDTNSGLTVTDTRAAMPDTWIAQTPAQVEVDYVTKADSPVYQGRGYPVYVVVKNFGGARLILSADSITMRFRRAIGDTNVSDSFPVQSRSGPAGVNGNSRETYTINILVWGSADTGGVVADASCTGVDYNRISLSVGDTDGTADPDTFEWVVQGRGVLEIVSVRSGMGSVSLGESGIVTVLTFRNIGAGNATDIDTPVLMFARNTTGTILSDTEFIRTMQGTSQQFPDTMLVGEQTTCTFTVKVSDSATTGLVYPQASVTGRVIGGTDTSADTTAGIIDTWTVQTPAAIDIVSILVDTTTIDNNNNDTVTLTVVVRNTGEATFRYRGDTAVFSNSKDSWTKISSTRAGDTYALAGGAYDTFYQIYKTSSDTGSVTVNQIVYGVDANDSRTLSDSGATAAASVTVDIPRPFRITRMEASRQMVSDSQTAIWTVTVTVRNQTLDTAIMDTFSFDDLTFRLTTGEQGTAADYMGTATANFTGGGTTTLSPGAEDTVIYTVTQTGDSAGALRVDVTLTGYDVYNMGRRLTRTTAGDDTTVYDTALVQNKAALSIIRVNAAADSVSRAQGGKDSVTVTVEVRNTGEADATITTDTLTFFKSASGGTGMADSFVAIQKAGGQPTRISGNASETWTYVVSVSATCETGVTVVEATFAGTDTNSGLTTTDTRATMPDTWVAQDTAYASLDSTTSSSLVIYQGQSGYVVRVSVRNRGEARLDLLSDSITLKFRNVTNGVDETDSFTWTAAVGNPTGVWGGRADTYAFSVAVNAKAGTGVVAVDAYCTGADGNRGSLAMTDTTAFPDTWAWDLQGAGVLDIVSVKSDTYVVSRGETGLVVALIYRNTGDGACTYIAAPTLRFSQGAADLTSNFTATMTANDTTYPITNFAVGATTSCTYTVTVSSTATTGSVDINASVSGITSGGAVTTTDTSATTPDSWNVQTAGAIGIASFAITEDTFIMQDGTGTTVLTDTFWVTVTVRNNGQANVDLTVDTSDLIFKNSFSKDVTAHFRVVLRTVPDTIAGLDTQTIVFLCTVPDSTTDSALGQVTAYIQANRPAAIDLNKRVDVSDASAASVTDTFSLFVQPNMSAQYTLTANTGSEQKVAATIPAGKFPDGTLFSVVINPSTPAITTGNTAAGNDFTKRAPASLATSIVQITASKSPTSTTKDISVVLKYDGTDVAASDIANLRVYKLNETTNVWEIIDDEKNQTVNTANSTVTGMTSGFSFFRVLVNVPVSPNLSSVIVYPNPFKPNDGNARTGVEYTGAAGTGITFANLTLTARIKIFTLAGELVDDISTSGQGRVQWDAKNSRGQPLASGVYIWSIDGNGSEKKVGKLAIIR